MMDGIPARGPAHELSEEQWSFLLSTYENRQQLLTENEALGERRIQTLLTVIGAAGVAVGLVADQVSDDALLGVGAAASGLLVVLGFLTNMRVAQRDCATSWYKLDLHRLRRFVAADHEALATALPHMDDAAPQLRERPWHPNRGGLVEMVGMLTAILAGVTAFAVAHLSFSSVGWSLVAGMAAVIGTWVLQIWAVRGIYRREGCMPSNAARGETFRAGIGVVVRNSDGNVLVLEREDHPGAWQFPQGGIARGETRLDAALRELREETGIDPSDVALAGELEQWLAYELPTDLRSRKTGLGQAQWWFLFDQHAGAPGPDLGNVATKQFRDAEWVTMDEAVRRAVDFRRPIYEALRSRFT
jgi:putative (di)nucleoside polyphosphate hydrolase